jgi:hypothetical protein
LLDTCILHVGISFSTPETDLPNFKKENHLTTMKNTKNKLALSQETLKVLTPEQATSSPNGRVSLGYPPCPCSMALQAKAGNR